MRLGWRALGLHQSGCGKRHDTERYRAAAIQPAHLGVPPVAPDRRPVLGRAQASSGVAALEQDD